MDKHLGVFITLMNSHLHVSLTYALLVITHHVTYPCIGHRGCAGIMLLGCYADEAIVKPYLIYGRFFLLGL